MKNSTTKIVSENAKVRPILKSMKQGEEYSFPIIKLKTVRSQASELGAILDFHFTTRTNREDRTIIVKRVR